MAFYQHLQIPKKTAAGSYVVPNVTDSRHLIFAVHCDANTTATLKVQGSVQEVVPNFAGASTSANDWSYIAFRNLGTSNLVAGATGITISNTTHHQTYEIESNGLTHIAFELTTVSGDGVSITVLNRNDV
jgi:hypothetical protein